MCSPTRAPGTAPGLAGGHEASSLRTGSGLDSVFSHCISPGSNELLWQQRLRKGRQLGRAGRASDGTRKQAYGACEVSPISHRSCSHTLLYVSRASKGGPDHRLRRTVRGQLTGQSERCCCDFAGLSLIYSGLFLARPDTAGLSSGDEAGVVGKLSAFELLRLQRPT